MSQPNVNYIIKYNILTYEIISLSDAGGSYQAEGAVSGEENVWVLHYVGHITGNYAIWCATHYIKDFTIFERPYRPSEYHNWYYDIEKWVPDYSLAWTAIREHRDNLLTKSDWTQIADNQLTDEKKAEWRTYRQALRDITTYETLQPQDPPFPEYLEVGDVPWPTPPE